MDRVQQLGAERRRQADCFGRPTHHYPHRICSRRVLRTHDSADVLAIQGHLRRLGRHVRRVCQRKRSGDAVAILWRTIRLADVRRGRCHGDAPVVDEERAERWNQHRLHPELTHERTYECDPRGQHGQHHRSNCRNLQLRTRCVRFRIRLVCHPDRTADHRLDATGSHHGDAAGCHKEQGICRHAGGDRRGRRADVDRHRRSASGRADVERGFRCHQWNTDVWHGCRSDIDVHCDGH